MSSATRIDPWVRVLGLLKSSKLEYLKTVEGQYPTDTKRFLHRQARLRHHHFQDLELKIRGQFPEATSLHLSGIQMEQRLVASFDQNTKTSLEKCLEIDREIITILHSIDVTDIDSQALEVILENAITSIEKIQLNQKSQSRSWI